MKGESDDDWDYVSRSEEDYDEEEQYADYDDTDYKYGDWIIDPDMGSH